MRFTSLVPLNVIEVIANGGRTGGGLTVTRKLVLVLNDPSLTVTVMSVVPLWLDTGVTVTVRLEPLPPNAILPFGTSVWFEDTPLTVKLLAGLSMSPTVKPIGPATVPALIV